MEKLVELYFHRGFHYDEILWNLAIRHNIVISMKTLKRRLKNLNLWRRKNYTDLDTVLKHLQNDVKGYGQLHGYRWQHLRCIQSGLVVTQDTVRKGLQIVDPEGVDVRKRKRLRRRIYESKGPSYLWHFDSYDKLKKYGICINGCIDGFSRYILWLNAGMTSNDPKVVAGYYIQCIEELKAVPLTMRCDAGTENVVIKRIQMELRENYSQSGRPSFLIGKSQHNQRIESWWGQLRKHDAQFWINFFEDIKNDGEFDGSDRDKSLIQFTFMDIIREELKNVVHVWNTHNISGSKNSRCPRGRPHNLWHLHELYGVNNYAVEVSEEHINECVKECTFEIFPCDEDVYRCCNALMKENNLEMGKNAEEGKALYLWLRSEFINNQIFF